MLWVSVLTLSACLPDEPQRALVEKVSYLDGEIVAICPDSGPYLIEGKSLSLENKQILCAQGSQDLKD